MHDLRALGRRSSQHIVALVGHLAADQHHQIRLAHVSRETRKPAEREIVARGHIGEWAQSLHHRHAQEFGEFDQLRARVRLGDFQPDDQQGIVGFHQHPRRPLDQLRPRLHARCHLEAVLRDDLGLSLRIVQVVGHLQEHGSARRRARHLDRPAREFRHALELIHPVTPLHERIEHRLPFDQLDVAAPLRGRLALARRQHDQ